jgi:hypothetical protein
LTSRGGKKRNQIDHILTDRRGHTSVLDVQSFRGADFETNKYLIVSKVRERLAVRKRAKKKSNMNRCKIKKL